MTIHLLTVAGLSAEMWINLPGLPGLWTIYKPAMFQGRILKDSSDKMERVKDFKLSQAKSIRLECGEIG